MDLLPTALGTRPRLAIEIRPEGVIAARAEDAAALVSAVSFGPLASGAVLPGLRRGNLGNRRAVVAAVRSALESVMLKERQTSLVLPDAAVRVLLLDFDTLPAKPAEALPVVRFRLKKLLPFDADDAVVSFQVMSSAKGLVRVVAVAVPREVLAEYEEVIREAGFEPGAVLPSTLAALSGLGEDEESTLVVNAGESSVTTAIVEGGVLLLHRMVDFAAEGVEIAPVAEVTASPQPLPLVDLESSSAEWTMQQPLNGYGVLDDDHINDEADEQAQRLRAEIEHQFGYGPPPELPPLPQEAFLREPLLREQMLPPLPDPVTARVTAAAREVTQAVSVAAAYFEDTLFRMPDVVLSTGTLDAGELSDMIAEAGFSDQQVRVRAMVDTSMLTAGASSTRAPMGWLAGVRGALRS